MRYKVGDKVIIKKHKERECSRKNCASMVEGMLKYIGKIATITGIMPRHYYIDLDDQVYSWSNCMIEKSPLEAKDEIKVTKKSTEYQISEGNVSITATKDVNGKITLSTRNGFNEFVFINSKPELIKRIAKLIERASEC